MLGVFPQLVHEFVVIHSKSPIICQDLIGCSGAQSQGFIHYKPRLHSTDHITILEVYMRASRKSPLYWGLVFCVVTLSLCVFEDKKTCLKIIDTDLFILGFTAPTIISS